MPDPVVLVELEPGAADAGGLRRAAYDEILAPSFAPEELFSYEELVADHAIVVAVREGIVVAVGACDPGEPGGIVLLSYLAARPGLRGGGLGGAVLAHLGARWRSQGAGLVVGEIHDPRCHPEGPDERPAARVRFYARAGAEVLGPWVQPSLSPGLPRVPGMLLVSFHRAGRFAGPAVPAAPVVAWVRSYYEASEGASTGDRGLDELVARYDCADGIPVRPLDAYSSVEPIRFG